VDITHKIEQHKITDM